MTLTRLRQIALGIAGVPAFGIGTAITLSPRTS